MNISLEYLCINGFVESDDVSPPSPHGSNVSGGSDSTIAYINSDPEDTEYDTSDDEPLAKYRAKTEEGNDKSDGDVHRGRGRPRGKAKPKKQFETAGFNKIQRNV